MILNESHMCWMMGRSCQDKEYEEEGLFHEYSKRTV